eukprot:gnl/MRDRNA2_/MRDRNA2_362643_c0_seq1.p1 gnl/MRDRNA2_/MRDRNA2_362643_c0~~gnl/MRDRNA2_/MRDRNA2_362643_c0_seq1.p1  ORF type:complete len:116 (+),score=4.91 gnl/MRDRNA2_/MRDRNA2_362643_c0_seq1:1-348(+)
MLLDPLAGTDITALKVDKHPPRPAITHLTMTTLNGYQEIFARCIVFKASPSSLQIQRSLYIITYDVLQWVSQPSGALTIQWKTVIKLTASNPFKVRSQNTTISMALRASVISLLI